MDSKLKRSIRAAALYPLGETTSPPPLCKAEPSPLAAAPRWPVSSHPRLRREGEGRTPLAVGRCSQLCTFRTPPNPNAAPNRAAPLRGLSPAAEKAMPSRLSPPVLRIQTQDPRKIGTAPLRCLAGDEVPGWAVGLSTGLLDWSERVSVCLCPSRSPLWLLLISRGTVQRFKDMTLPNEVSGKRAEGREGSALSYTEETIQDARGRCSQRAEGILQLWGHLMQSPSSSRNRARGNNRSSALRPSRPPSLNLQRLLLGTTTAYLHARPHVQGQVSPNQLCAVEALLKHGALFLQQSPQRRRGRGGISIKMTPL